MKNAPRRMIFPDSWFFPLRFQIICSRKNERKKRRRKKNFLHMATGGRSTHSHVCSFNYIHSHTSSSIFQHFIFSFFTHPKAIKDFSLFFRFSHFFMNTKNSFRSLVESSCKSQVSLKWNEASIQATMDFPFSYLASKGIRVNLTPHYLPPALFTLRSEGDETEMAVFAHY
jgi:hypothetical protein